MLLNTNIIIAIKDKHSKYVVEKTNIFGIKQISNKITPFKISIKNKELILKVNCPLCNRIHGYKYKVNSLVNREMLIGGCETLNTPLFFIGEENSVMKKINKYEQVNGQINMLTIK
ncbi:hypothetical protein [Haloimpatiens massiliensis]|uniref:hypothetical protein n=1 Tax=Haloimpatiens massiliensis TaxID=1658110 RepID=UPI000C82FC4B|nr:hypothetical protein [Haloimpatiens massiliensis]